MTKTRRVVDHVRGIELIIASQPFTLFRDQDDAHAGKGPRLAPYSKCHAENGRDMSDIVETINATLT